MPHNGSALSCSAREGVACWRYCFKHRHSVSTPAQIAVYHEWKIIVDLFLTDRSSCAKECKQIVTLQDAVAMVRISYSTGR